MSNVLVTLVDKNFIDQAKQLFSSAYWNGGWQGDFLLLAHEVPESELEWFKEKGILVYPVNQSVTSARYGRWPSIILGKFFLFTPYFKKWERVVYLDADIIVQGPLAKLTHCEGFTAAPDRYSRTVAQEFKHPSPSLQHAYRLSSPAFNSGVLVIETKSIRNETFEDLQRLSERYQPEVRYGEQAILNLYWLGKWNRLPVIYNFLANHPQYRKMDRTRVKAAILHFAWRPKPWDPRSKFHDAWSDSLRRADVIDLKNPPSQITALSPAEIWRFELSLKCREITWKMKQAGQRFTREVKKRFHRFMYCVGRIIKTISPRLYYGLGGKN